MTSKVHSGVGNRKYQLAQVEGVKEKITTRGEGPGCRLGEPRDNSVIVVDGELCRCSSYELRSNADVRGSEHSQRRRTDPSTPLAVVNEAG